MKNGCKNHCFVVRNTVTQNNLLNSAQVGLALRARSIHTCTVVKNIILSYLRLIRPRKIFIVTYLLIMLSP